MRNVTILVLALVMLWVPAASAAPQLVTIDVPSAGNVDPREPILNNGLRDLRANVLLPDGYDGSRAYPVLYLLHGIADDYRTWSDPTQGGVREAVGDADVIVVMPEAGRSLNVDWYSAGPRMRRAWARYYLEELIPQIHARFTILPGRRNHAIAGISMGGYGALYLASQLPEYFGAAASLSGIVDIRQAWLSELMYPIARASHRQIFGPPFGSYVRAHDFLMLRDNLRDTRVLITNGDGIPVPAARDQLLQIIGLGGAEANMKVWSSALARRLRAADVDVTTWWRRGIHDWWYWRQDVRRMLAEWDPFATVPEAPARWRYTSMMQQGSAWGIGFAFGARPAAPLVLRRDGSRLTAEGSGTVTLQTPDGCRRSVALPGTVDLAAACPG